MSPFKFILDFLSSVRVGIVFMVLLFVYSAIGSAGIPIHWALWEPTTWYALREASWLEMTEFEWFHWWPFYVLVGMFSLVLVVTTIRRIPFNKINLGVWTIHTGIIMLVVWLFGWILFGIPTLIIGLIALIEGIIYLTKDDDAFTETYEVQKKGWF